MPLGWEGCHSDRSGGARGQRRGAVVTTILLVVDRSRFMVAVEKRARCCMRPIALRFQSVCLFFVYLQYDLCKSGSGVLDLRLMLFVRVCFFLVYSLWLAWPILFCSILSSCGAEEWARACPVQELVLFESCSSESSCPDPGLRQIAVLWVRVLRQLALLRGNRLCSRT